MTEKEIIEYIGFSGTYTKNVKKKLNKLIKKYHPDRNKNDKTTILILYSVKERLENNTLTYTKNNDNDNSIYNSNQTNNINKKEKIYDTKTINFINRIINILIRKKDFFNKELNKIYNKEYYYNKKLYKNSELDGYNDIEIENILEILNSLKKVNYIDILYIIFIFIFIGLSFYNIIFSIFLLFIIYFEYSFIKERYNEYNKFLILLRKKKIKKEKYSIKNKNYEKILNELNRYEINLKNERRMVSNDIAFYNHELSLSNNYSKHMENVNDNRKIKKKSVKKSIFSSQ